MITIALQPHDAPASHAGKVLLFPSKIELETRKLFDVLTAAWKSDTHVKLSANPKAVLDNSAYCYLIEIGAAILPLIFEDYEREDSAWPAALHRIVGLSPVKSEHRGKAKLIREDWLAWGRENGYLLCLTPGGVMEISRGLRAYSPDTPGKCSLN